MLTAALLLAALAAQPSGAAHIPPAAPRAHLDGPVNFCADEFSVWLARGESMDWTPLARGGGTNYVMQSGPIVANIARTVPNRARYVDRLPPEVGTGRLSLPFSPISRRRAYPMPELVEMNRQGEVRSTFSFGIEYLLHGVAPNASPLMVLAVAQSPQADIPFVGRIDPRPLAERRCTPAWTDPALAGRITHEPGR